jgi:dienelactone hydrolase
MKPKVILFNFCLFMLTTFLHAQTQPVAYSDGSQQLNGVLAKPSNAHEKHAGILILPAWMGIDEHSKTVAKDLANMGYTAFVADIYGAGNYPKSPKDAGAQSGHYKQHIDEYHHRIQLALEQLIKAGANPDDIVVIGYCFGGLGAIEAARINMPVKGIVSFHGSYERDSSKAIQPIQPKILILHGADDPHSSAEVIAKMQQEFRTAKADWQMTYYGNAVHAFTDPGAGTDNSKGAAYNAIADRRSWDAMLAFLKEVL